MTTPFRPAWWCRGGHAQTLGALILRPTPHVPLQRERWDTPDGDFLDVDRVAGDPGVPCVVMFHGLESSSRAKQVLGFMAGVHRVGWEGLAVNFRTCSGELNRLPRAYHGGDTAELAWLLQRVIAEDPTRPVGCLGISLGGNVLVKYLGEQGAQLPTQIRAAVAISAPFDLAISVTYLERGMSRLYMWTLVRSLKQKMFAKLKQYPDVVDPSRLRAVRTLAQFDHLVTGPLHGFSDGHAYWRAASSAPFIPGIQRPTLLINSSDDPFFPADALPTHAVAQNASVSAEFVPSGGHMGFLEGGWPGRPILWAERRTMAFFHEHLHAAGRTR